MNIQGSRLVAAGPRSLQSVVRSAVTLKVLVAALAGALSFVLFVILKDQELGFLLLAYVLIYLLFALQLDFVCIGMERPWVLAKSRLLSSLIFGALVFLFVREKTPVWVIPLLQGIGLLFGLIVQYAFLREVLSDRPALHVEHITSLGGLFKSGLLLTGAGFLGTGYYSIDKIILGFYFVDELSVVGDYTAATRLIQLAVMPITALLMTVAPKYSHGFISETSGEFIGAERVYKSGSILFGLVGALVLLFVGPTVLEFTSGRPMPVVTHTLRIAAIGYLIVGLHSPFTSVLPFISAEKAYFNLNLVAFLSTAVLTMILVPWIGYAGAAVGWTLGILSLLVVGYPAYQSHRGHALWAKTMK